jgi:hypothetical protein
MIEDLVLNGICSLLKSNNRLARALPLEDIDVERVLAEGTRLGKSLPQDDPVAQRDFVLDVIRRIELCRDRISITFLTQALLMKLGQIPPDKNSTKTDDGDQEFTEHIPVQLRRRGVEKKLVITDDSERPPAPDPLLIQAIAQGHYWFWQIKTGDVSSVKDLVERHGLNQADVSRILRLGLLAPDIVEAIHAGKQPVELTARKLKRIGELPISWADQRRVLGFV